MKLVVLLAACALSAVSAKELRKAFRAGTKVAAKADATADATADAAADALAPEGCTACLHAGFHWTLPSVGGGTGKATELGGGKCRMHLVTGGATEDQECKDITKCPDYAALYAALPAAAAPKCSTYVAQEECCGKTGKIGHTCVWTTGTQECRPATKLTNYGKCSEMNACRCAPVSLSDGSLSDASLSDECESGDDAAPDCAAPVAAPEAGDAPGKLTDEQKADNEKTFVSEQPTVVSKKKTTGKLSSDKLAMFGGRFAAADAAAGVKMNPTSCTACLQAGFQWTAPSAGNSGTKQSGGDFAGLAGGKCFRFLQVGGSTGTDDVACCKGGTDIEMCDDYVAPAATPGCSTHTAQEECCGKKGSKGHTCTWTSGTQECRKASMLTNGGTCSEMNACRCAPVAPATASPDDASCQSGDDPAPDCAAPVAAPEAGDAPGKLTDEQKADFEKTFVSEQPTVVSEKKATGKLVIPAAFADK